MGQAQHAGWAVLNPAGHVVLSFPTAMQAARAARALAGIGLNGTAVRRLSDRQMRARLDDELEQATAMDGHDDEVAVAHDHRRRAERGCHWLVVRASNDGRACQVADCLRPLGAATARYYSHFVVQELFEPGPAHWRTDTLWDEVVGAPARAAAARDGERAALPLLRVVADRVG